MLTRLESVCAVVDDDGIPHATGNSDGTQHADVVVIAKLCCLTHAVFALLGDKWLQLLLCSVPTSALSIATVMREILSQKQYSSNMLSLFCICDL